MKRQTRDDLCNINDHISASLLLNNLKKCPTRCSNRPERERVQYVSAGWKSPIFVFLQTAQWTATECNTGNQLTTNLSSHSHVFLWTSVSVFIYIRGQPQRLHCKPRPSDTHGECVPSCWPLEQKSMLKRNDKCQHFPVEIQLSYYTSMAACWTPLQT